MLNPPRWLLVVSVIVSAACANTRVTVPRMAPAEVDLKSYSRLAVGGIAGPGGNDVNALLTEALVATKHFDVLDRVSLANLIHEQNLAVSGRVSDESAVSVGQLIGAAALVVGDVNDMTYTESVDQKYAQCSNNGRVYECQQYTRSAAAHCAVTLKVLATETGKVLAARAMEFTESRSETKDGEPPKAFKADKAMLDACNRQIAQRFAAVVAPHSVNVTVELLDDGDLPDLERGNNFAKTGNWQSALQAYQSAVASLTEETKPAVQAKAYYDLGVAYSFSGDHDSGITQLERAYSLAPNDRTAQLLAQVKQFKTDDAALATQRR